MDKKRVLCYSKFDFEDLMSKNQWYAQPGDNSAVISIDSHNEDDYGHFYSPGDSVFNLDIDDCGPIWFGSHENECYDKALEWFDYGEDKISNSYFSHLYLSGNDNQYCSMIHVMDYEEACKLAIFIDRAIRTCDTIYVHCYAGLSRSQGVVRYIIDTYGDEYEIETNPNNPCNTPNSHVVLMLKRAFRILNL